MPVIAMLAAAVFAQSEPTTAPLRANGYVSERFGFAMGWMDDDAGAPALAKLYGVPPVNSLTEVNLQVRLKIHEGYDAFSDLSFFFNAQPEAKGVIGQASVATVRVEPSELYLNLGFTEHLNGLVGRKRLVWGSGFAWNPTDLLNPPKDPTDPSLQRAGAWMARVEAPFESFTLSALWAPKVVRTETGLPTRFLVEPGSNVLQHLFAARVYALILQTDVNLMWFWSNRYADSLPHSHRFALSFSRYFFSDYELHFEGVVQQGRDTRIVDPACLPSSDGSLVPLAICRAQGRPLVSSTVSDPSAIYVRFVAGTRYTFSDDSLLSLEYFFNGTGLDAAQFGDRQRLLDLAPTLLSLSPGTQLPDLLGSTDGTGGPLRFAFDTQRRHYLFLVYQRPHIADDFTVTATAIVDLEGPSAVLAPSLTWSAREWLNFTLFAFVPVGSRTSEFGSMPFRFRAMFEAKAFY